MAFIHQIRGAILEEAVAFLLRMVGYRIADANDPGTRNGHSGLEVLGRGCWHQIDTLACLDATPAFMYPLRLILEAKCYEQGKIGIEVVRNSVGVLKDISENYFSHKTTGNDEIQIQRFNYHSAIFSTSGFTSVAQKLAIAHQIFLIDYEGIKAITPLIEAIREIQISDLNKVGIRHPERVKRYFGGIFKNRDFPDFDPLSKHGRIVLEKIGDSLGGVQGSYFAMLQGRWPLHIVSEKALPQSLFRDTDLIRCRVYGYHSNKWSFSPIDFKEGEDNWFRLEFKLPEEIGKIVASSWDDPVKVANIKQEHFSYMVLSGQIGGINRVIRLELDRQWIEEYRRRMERRIPPRYRTP